MDDDFEAWIRRSQRRRRVGLIVGALVFFGGIAALVGRQAWRKYRVTHPPSVALSKDQRSSMTARIAQSRWKIQEADQPWRTAIESVKPVESATGRTCKALEYARRVTGANPQSGSFGSWELSRVELPISQFRGGSTASLSRAPFPIGFVKRGEPLPSQSPEARHYLRELARIEAELDQPSWQTFAGRLAAATVDELRARDVLLRVEVAEEASEVRTSEVRPGVIREFVPGRLVAHAWVFDHELRRVVCAGVVEAQSSVTIDTGVSNLNDDLLTNLIRAIPDGVRAVP